MATKAIALVRLMHDGQVYEAGSEFDWVSGDVDDAVEAGLVSLEGHQPAQKTPTGSNSATKKKLEAAEAELAKVKAALDDERKSVNEHYNLFNEVADILGAPMGADIDLPQLVADLKVRAEAAEATVELVAETIGFEKSEEQPTMFALVESIVEKAKKYDALPKGEEPKGADK